MEVSPVVRVKVPATTANLGPGFDTLGMALSLFNQVEMAETGTNGELIIEVEGEGVASIARDQTNVTYLAAQEVFRITGYAPAGIYLRLQNRIPSARGLGSSAAARVGGLMAANSLAGGQLNRDQLLEIAVQLEGHPDNVAPALLGGLVVTSLSSEKVVYHRIAVLNEVTAILAIPHFELATQAAIQALPRFIPVKDAVFNIGQACLLVAGFISGDWKLVGQSMQDRVHQAYRQHLIPGLEEVITAANQAGALGAALSGAGPTVLALAVDDWIQTDGIQGIHQIGEAMQKAFSRNGVESTVLLLKPINEGAVLFTE
jgi:homoserine kinase